MDERTRPARAQGDAGASLVEYALLVALIAIACIAAISFFGSSTASRNDNSASSIINAG
jgi:Flp pilus assembly pilin Flp